MMPDELFKKNVEMWERFTTAYMDTMFKTVEKTMDQSEAFRSQMDRVVNEAVSNQLQATVATLQIMQQQMETLTEKVDRLLQKMEAE